MASCEERSLGVIDRVVSVFTRYIYFEERTYYYLCSIYVLLSFIYKKTFSEVPYLGIYGPKGCGKSRLGAILKGLCSNGKYFSDITPALLIRMIEKATKGITIVFDEAENLPDLMLRILRSGYRHDGMTGRWNVRNDDADWFKTFCPKIVINQRGLNDPPLESRTIPVHMIKSAIRLEKYRSKDATQEFEEIQKLINSFFDEHGDVVEKEYRAFQTVEGLSDRDEEIWQPILVIASVLDLTLPEPFLKEEMLTLARNLTVRRRRTQLIGDKDGQILEGTLAYVKQAKPQEIDGVYAYVGEYLCKFIKKSWGIPSLTLETVSRTLRHHEIIVGYKRPRLGKLRQRTCYELDIPRLIKIAKEYFEEGEINE